MGILAVLGTQSAAFAAPSIVIDFDDPGYTIGPGSPSGQNGWLANGTGFDLALVENSSFPDSGLGAGRSLRVSNATIPGTRFLRSPIIDSAGEPGVAGATANTFAAQYTVASATGAVQDGLLLEVPIDSASRYGGVIVLRHTAAGLEIGSFWLPPEATGAGLSQWRSETFAVVDPSVPHTIDISALFRADASDVVRIQVDGELVSACSGVTTWENYFRVTGNATDALVDELTFRLTTSAPSESGVGYLAGLPPAPGTAGNGFLFADIGYEVFDSELPSPANPDEEVAPEPTATPDAPLAIDPDALTGGGTVTVTGSGFQAGEDVLAVLYPEATPLGWLTADESGDVAGDLDVPEDVAPGAKEIQVSGAASACTALGSLDIQAVEPTPSPTPTPTPTATPEPAPTGAPTTGPEPSAGPADPGSGAGESGGLAVTGSSWVAPGLLATALLGTGVVLLAVARRMRKSKQHGAAQ